MKTFTENSILLRIENGETIEDGLGASLLRENSLGDDGIARYSNCY